MNGSEREGVTRGGGERETAREVREGRRKERGRKVASKEASPGREVVKEDRNARSGEGASAGQ